MATDVVETYVPIVREGRFLGALEIYLDVGETKMRLERLLAHLKSARFIIATALFGAVLLSSLRASRALAARARLCDEAKRLSLHDPLTGLANRRLLEMDLERALALARRSRKGLSIIMIDIDRFKEINDSGGHGAGDEVLKAVARAIAGEVRSANLVARMGGDEFLVLLPETGEGSVREVAERVRRGIEEKTGRTASLGVASFREGAGSKGELIAAADRALYRAKEGGRNRVESSG